MLITTSTLTRLISTEQHFVAEERKLAQKPSLKNDFGEVLFVTQNVEGRFQNKKLKNVAE